MLQLYKRTRHCHLWILALVVTWWLANAVTSIAAKAFMIGQSHDHSHDVRSVTTALQDLRWIDLTAIQLAVSGILTMAWVKLCRVKTPRSATETNQKIILMASLGNMVGNLATNASYAAINSSTTQMIKACEPVFTFALLIILGRQKHKNLKCSVLFSLLVMSTGTCVFIAWDSSFNIWGIVAALVSNFAYPLRNIYIKSLSKSWTDNPIHQYSTISLYSLLFIFPIVMTKLLATGKMLASNFEEFLTLTGSHLTYNIASIHVLRAISPLHHAILNLFKRIFVIIINILYFSTPVDFLAAVGFVVLVVGLLLYYKTYHPLWLLPRVFSSIPKLLIFCTLSLSSVISLSFFSCHLYPTVIRVPFSRPYHSSNDGSETTCQNIISSWVYAKPLPESVLQNLNAWTNTSPISPVHVFCGNFHCLKTLTGLKGHNVTASFLVISELVENTIFEDWFTRHPLNKVLEGVNFENHLQQVVSLILIWRYGGTYIDPRVNIDKTQLYSLDTKQPLIFLPSNDSRHDILGLFNFPKEHSFIRVIGETFVGKYTKDIENTTSCPMAFNFREITLEACRQHNKHCPKIIHLQYRHLSVSDSSETVNSFGTLSYDSRVRVTAVTNLGDEIQGFPGLQFVPFVKDFLERDKLHQWKATETNITCFFNAWWGSRYTKWPPPPNIDPITLSMHIGNAVKLMMSKNIEYLRKKSPIGCRDPGTLEFLRKQGVEAFFSGCLTLLMKNPMKMNKRTENIYLADVNHEVRKLLPLEIQQKGILVKHNMNGDARYDKYARFKAAYDLIEKYSTAKLVVTQRIHSALPCVAMGTPVIFINSPNMPGGGGTKTKRSLRTQGFDELFYSVDLYKFSTDEAKRWLRSFDWTNPRPAPQVSLLKRLRATSWNVIRKKKPLYEAALKFGIIPFQSFIHFDRTKQKLFHLIFTTNGTGFIKLFSNSVGKVPSSFNWRHWRCIESIFYFHPLAKVIIHSNTLPHSFFDVLKESGYDIEVWRYNLTEMVSGTPAENFMIKRYKEVKNGPYWYSHETDLLRMVLLYKFGGVYMDTDIIMVRSIEELSINVVGYQTGRKTMNGAFLYFEKKHPFIKACLERFAENYNPYIWSASGPYLITNILHSNVTRYNVNVLPQHAFYMFKYISIIDECFQQTSGKVFEDNMKILKEKAFVVHLFSKFSAAQGMDEKLKDGTICKRLLNSFCVFCDKTY